MMLWKYCTQYANKFGKLSSGQRTWTGRFSFQSQRKAMPKSAQTTTQLHSSHTLAKKCSKFSKPGFNTTWTMNFQMFKLDLEKADESEISCQHPLDHQKSKRVQKKKKLLLLNWLGQSCSLCGSQQLWKILKEMGILDHLTCLLRNVYAGQEATDRTGCGATNWFQIRRGVCQGCILSSCLFNLYAWLLLVLLLSRFSHVQLCATP